MLLQQPPIAATPADPVVDRRPLPPLAPPTPRILGYDLARAVAIFAMLVDHTIGTLGADRPGTLGEKLTDALDGRASAVFVMLAGVGISLLGRRGDGPAALRRTLCRRGAVLLVMGLAVLAVWPGDILRVFGAAFVLAAFLTHVRPARLLRIALLIVAAFPALMLAFDYGAHRDWTTMRYDDLWTPAGMLRNLLFDGFRPVVPWAGLLVLGMWLGRLDATNPAVRRRLLACGLALVASVEVGSRVLRHFWLAHPGPLGADTIRTICDTGSMPPLPAFVLTVTGTALAVIALCLMAAARWPRAAAVRALVSTGQLALTWYVAHVCAGALVAALRGWGRGASLTASLLIALSAFAVIVAASTLYKRRWKTGPLESLLRAAG